MDIHPRPANAQIEVRVGGTTFPLGQLDESSLIQSIHASHLVLAMAVWDHYFIYEEIKSFEFLYHFDSLDECESFLAEDWKGIELDPAIAPQARDLLAGGNGRLLIREPARAACLRRA
jgi:hypothetical protein